MLNNIQILENIHLKFMPSKKGMVVNMKNKVFVISSIVIFIGIIIVAILGFNVDFCYKNHNLIDITIGQDFNISDIKAITDEVFKNKKVEIQKTGSYSDGVVIKVDEVTEEQKQLLNTKINEKYGTDNEVEEDIKVNYIPSFRLRDIIKPYIIPMAIATVIVLVYMTIRFRKFGAMKVVGEVLVLTILAELLYMAIIAITRYPINRVVLPVGIIIYIATITVLTGIMEKRKNMTK